MPAAECAGDLGALAGDLRALTAQGKACSGRAAATEPVTRSGL